MKRLAIVALSAMLAFGIIPVRAEESEEGSTSDMEEVTDTADSNDTSDSSEDVITDESNKSEDSGEADDSKQDETSDEEITSDADQTASSDSEVTGSETATEKSEIAEYAANLQVPNLVNVSTLTYSVHVQDYGWMNPVTGNQIAGTTGQSKRVEAMKISLPNELASLGDIRVEAHVQDYGWMPSVGNNQIIGTTGQSKRVEALKISLTGELAKQYNVVYRTHVQDYGWQFWKRNGEITGTTGQSKAIEAIQIDLQSKEDAVPIQNVSTTIEYNAHVQNIGWMTSVANGETAGTPGQRKRVEAFQVALNNEMLVYGGISAEAHVQDIGWMNPVGNGEVAGLVGKSKRLEAIKLSLTGELANYYNVYYRSYVGNVGWLGWAMNGDISGSVGCNRRIEAIQIIVFSKDDENAPETGNSFTTEVEAPVITYKAHVQDIGWMSAVKNGEVAGTTGQSKRVEAMQVSLNDDMLAQGNVSVQAHMQDYGWVPAVSNNGVAGVIAQSKRMEAMKISLTGDLANNYDIFYRCHVGNVGWLGWAKNGGLAGSVGCNRRIEAFEIRIYAKGDSDAPKVGNSSTTSVENLQYTPTYYSQRDPRWATSPTYGGYNLQSTGCVPTAIAMAVDGILHNGVTPVTMADYLYYNTSEFSTIKHGGSCLAVKLGAEHWGLKTTPIGTYQDLVNCLNAGNIVVMAVGPGTFTSRGYTHEITMFRNSGGNTYVYDPWNAHNGWYSISMIWSQQSTNSYDLRGGYVGYGIHQ